MKKVLSFVLVLAMILGSVSMAFAAGTDYVDDAAITNKEAVGVLSGLKVLEGDANGFRPNDTLTRAEAAAIIARLVLGREDADKLTASAALFSDVPASHWAAGYIAYCVSQGIIAGNGDGTFTPSGLLTVPAFGKMLLCALGYDASVEGLVGSNWEANTASLMVKAGVTSSASGACTRDNAAAMGLKALKADVVEYATKGTSVNIGGTIVTTGGSAATPVKYTGNVDENDYNNKNDHVQQLAEKVYGNKLKLTTAQADKFGRPGNEWSYFGSINKEYVGSIGTFGKSAEQIFTAKMTAKEVNAVLNGFKVKNLGANPEYVTVNNTTKTSAGAFGPVASQTAVKVNNNAAFALVNTATDSTLAEIIADLTEDGEAVEVYVDGGVITDIVVLSYVVAKVDDISEGKTFTSYTLIPTKAGEAGFTGKIYTDGTKDQDTLKLYGSVAEGDYVTYVELAGTVEKYHVYPTTKVTGTQTAFTSGTHTTITVDGTTYTVGTGVATDAIHTTYLTSANFANDETSIYLDQYGYAVHSKKGSSNDYAYVLQAYAKVSTDSLGNVDVKPSVKVILMDGTVGTYEVKTKMKSDDRYLDGWDTSALTSGKGATTAAGIATVAALSNHIVTYSMSNGVIKIEKLLAVNGGTKGTKYEMPVAFYGKQALPNAGTIDEAANTMTNGAIDAVANVDTKFVVYNQDKSTAKVVDGVKNMPKMAVGVASKAALVYEAGSVNIAKVVFLQTTKETSGTKTSYAWVKTTSDVSTTKSGDDTIYSYAKSFNKYGEQIAVTDDAEIATTHALGAIVEIDANNGYIGAYTENVGTTTAAIVSNSILEVGSTYYTIDANTVTVYVDADANKVNGHHIVFVYDDDDMTVETIYVLNHLDN